MDRPSKDALKKVLLLNNEILSLLPEGDSMYKMYSKMSFRLEERINTYEQFYINPYSVHTSLPKYDSEKDIREIGGDYISGRDD